MAQVFVSIGSNINREHYINSCLDALQIEFGELELSSVYESEAVGFDGDCFYNMVAAFHTELSVGQLNLALKGIEDRNQRSRQGPKFSGRTLDIDILTYDALIGDIEGVALPREEIIHNAFVLCPLAELAPKECHPVLAETYQQLWLEYDKASQKLWLVDFSWQDEKISQMSG
ncbi:2-amino-4-hydroxy-6-hydroxymethyldihydropteridine diphosphokinase [Amphritea sp. HPY]|uniref:2-amino-4-hydroxy-6- hydroxymethyldihydropteridine diphosphokinase n=1 Tax=Amphritea sp. HPY TaxID=3421652 RepID=UPI003D7C62CD